MSQGATQVDVGLGAAAVTGIETLGAGAVLGGVVALHGAGVGLTATRDIAQTLKELYRLNASVTAGVDVGSNSTENTSPKNGETSATKTGRDAHKNYNPGNNYTVDRSSNTLENNRVPDGIDLKNKIVRELKPNNPRKIREGINQVKAYIKQLKKQYGGKWKYAIDTYDVSPNGSYKYNYGKIIKSDL